MRSLRLVTRPLYHIVSSLLIKSSILVCCPLRCPLTSATANIPKHSTPFTFSLFHVLLPFPSSNSLRVPNLHLFHRRKREQRLFLPCPLLAEPSHLVYPSRSSLESSFDLVHPLPSTHTPFLRLFTSSARLLHHHDSFWSLGKKTFS